MSLPTPTDRSLRACAWVIPLALVASVVVGLPVAAAAESQSVSSAVGELMLALVALAFPIAGALIVRSRPRNRVGWLLEAIGGAWLMGAFTDVYVTYGAVVNPGSLPFTRVAAAFNAISWAPALGLTGTLLILLYPDGRLPSPGWRYVAWLSAFTISALPAVMLLTPSKLDTSPIPEQMNPFGWQAAGPVLGVLLGVLLALLPLCVIACVAGLVVRFRRSRGIERLQLKWLATAAAFVGMCFPLSMGGPAIARALTGDESIESFALLDTLALTSFALLPLATGVAILRHRLYDIDLVIKRTLVYATLTALLAGVYLGGVLLLQVLLSPLTHQSDLAVAGSTLTVAALFGPARRRIQTAVDRRFNRNRYDAAATLEAFSARLRDQVDLEAVGTELRSVVAQTLQPADVRLWIRS